MIDVLCNQQDLDDTFFEAAQPSHCADWAAVSIEYPMLLQTPANNAYNMDPSSANRGAQS